MLFVYVGGRGRVDDSLDPMDPAAYSDVPRYILRLHRQIRPMLVQSTFTVCHSFASLTSK